MTEPDLIARARTGDDAAWETLTRQHQEAVFRLAYLILGDPADADDVAQETFIRAYRALDRFDVTRSLRPWLFTIAANTARNRLRSVGRYLSALNRLLWADPTATTPTPPPEVNEATTLWQAVKRLNDMDQQIIYVRYFSGLSESETAQALQIAPGTVKSRTHRALERLRVIVEQDFPSLRESLLDE